LTALATRGLSKTYGEQSVVDGLDLTVERGELYGFLGPNGAGKTTTIRMALGLIRPSRGEVELPAAIRMRRDRLEQDLARLRERKGQLAEDEYLKLLEPLLVEIARIYEEASATGEGKKRPASAF